MMPYSSYRLYQIERVKGPAEIRHADEQAARLASAASSLFRSISRPFRVKRGPSAASSASELSRREGDLSRQPAGNVDAHVRLCRVAGQGGYAVFERGGSRGR
jgi:hypothetical protein